MNQDSVMGQTARITRDLILNTVQRSVVLRWLASKVLLLVFYSYYTLYLIFLIYHFRRIKTFLADRVTAWKSHPSVVGKQAELELEEVEKQIIKAKQNLVDLEKDHEKLDEIVFRGKSLECLSDDEETEDSAEGLFPCLICAQDVGCKTALRHWERCFQKAESQMSFASIYQTKIEGRPLFCDFYNERTQTYCKRLKVICPEHTKERRAENNEVCGAPLPETLLTDSDVLCKVPKKTCTKHYLWEKNRRAHIDVQRLRAVSY